FDEAAGGGGETFEVGLGKLETFGFPFGRDGEPVNAAALHYETRFEPARREEKTMEGAVAEEFGIAGFAAPGFGERAEEILIGIADPEAGFLHEPVELAEPLHGGVEAGIVEDLGLLAVA